MVMGLGPLFVIRRISAVWCTELGIHQADLCDDTLVNPRERRYSTQVFRSQHVDKLRGRAMPAELSWSSRALSTLPPTLVR